jgi:hypothetical protein
MFRLIYFRLYLDFLVNVFCVMYFNLYLHYLSIFLSNDLLNIFGAIGVECVYVVCVANL